MIYLRLFWEFLKIGALSFGGGYAMVAPVEQMVVQNNWMDAETFNKFLGVCESTPGPIAVNMATFVGSSQGGFLGALIATIGVVLPAFLIMLLLATILKSLQTKKVVQSILEGIRPAALGLIVGTGIWMIISLSVPNNQILIDWKALLIIGVLFIIPLVFEKLSKKKFSAIALIGLSALLGMALYTW